MHNKNRNPLLNVFINCISARSAPKIMSLKDGYTLKNDWLVRNKLIFWSNLTLP